MISLAVLEDIIEDQLARFRAKETGIPREIDFQKYIKTKQITAIAGIRRGGKSTLLLQFSKKYRSFYYINFDDERLIDFTVKDFDNLMLAFQKKYEAKAIFLDEIQNIDKWERFARRLYEEGYKIFLTGSNAKLLSSELATHLTGRYFKIELYPFSFREFLTAKSIDYQKKGSETRAAVLREFDAYEAGGGFPEYVKYDDPEFVQRIYEDVLYRDLLTRFGIRDVKAFKHLAKFLFSNISKEISYNGLKNTLGFKSVMSVKNYIEYMEQSYLVIELYKYDFSLKKQLVSGRKIYAIDNGMRNTIAYFTSQDEGRLLENLVFLELKRRGREIYYFKNKRECDFIVREKSAITEAIQVTAHFNINNREREVDGLLEAMDAFALKKGLILTQDAEDLLKIDSKNIIVKPIYKWLLEK